MQLFSPFRVEALQRPWNFVELASAGATGSALLVSSGTISANGRRSASRMSRSIVFGPNFA
jgi:hypothetical protein